MAFFEQLGFSFNPQFCDDTAACMVISDDIYTMLLTHEKFKGFTPKAICDATQSTEVLVCLSCESRAEVDALVVSKDMHFWLRFPPYEVPTRFVQIDTLDAWLRSDAAQRDIVDT